MFLTTTNSSILKTLYTNLRRSKWPIKDSYLYSPIVTFEVDGEKIPMKLVFVTKRGQADQYLVLATTMTDLRPEAIIQMYGRRWQIECYFKVAKQLNNTCNLIRLKFKAMMGFAVT